MEPWVHFPPCEVQVPRLDREGQEYRGSLLPGNTEKEQKSKVSLWQAVGGIMDSPAELPGTWDGKKRHHSFHWNWRAQKDRVTLIPANPSWQGPKAVFSQPWRPAVLSPAQPSPVRQGPQLLKPPLNLLLGSIWIFTPIRRQGFKF